MVFAASADTGQSLWEHVTAMTFVSDAAREMGNGPYSTPLIVGDRSWTPPVLVGTRLYLRDRGTMMAVDLG